MTAPYRGLGERGPRPNADARRRLEESGCLGSQPQTGGKFRPRLNTGERPIANKYREGKMQRTLKRESKVLEIVERETIEASRTRSWQSHGAEGALPSPRRRPGRRPAPVAAAAAGVGRVPLEGGSPAARADHRPTGGAPVVRAGQRRSGSISGGRRPGGGCRGGDARGRTASRKDPPRRPDRGGRRRGNARALFGAGGLRPHPARATDADATASTDPS